MSSTLLDTETDGHARLGPERRVPALGARPEHVAPGHDRDPYLRVLPGQVWNDEGVRGSGGPLLVICVDSAFAYCRGGREGDGATRRIPLAWFDERRRGGLTLVSAGDGPDDLVARRALTALWELDYLGRRATTEAICALLGELYPLARVEAALADAAHGGLVVRPEDEGCWCLTGGGRRIAAAA